MHPAASHQNVWCHSGLKRSQAERGSGVTWGRRRGEPQLPKACTETSLSALACQHLPVNRLPLGQQVKLQRRQALGGPGTWAPGSEGTES